MDKKIEIYIKENYEKHCVFASMANINDLLPFKMFHASHNKACGWRNAPKTIEYVKFVIDFQRTWEQEHEAENFLRPRELLELFPNLKGICFIESRYARKPERFLEDVHDHILDDIVDYKSDHPDIEILSSEAFTNYERELSRHLPWRFRFFSQEFAFSDCIP
jgi:hypothetical protein